MKPILFNTEMVKAILEGRRTQFRLPTFHQEKEAMEHILKVQEDKPHQIIISKYKVGDILYVQEPYYKLGCWAFSQMCDSEDHEFTGENCFNIVAYEDNIDTYDLAYPVFEYDLESAETMGEKEARIFLKVTNVRVERLQDISVRNIEKETGWRREIYSYSNKNKAFLRDYCDFWNSTAKDGYKWEDNPYVFVYEFERIFKEDN